MKFLETLNLEVQGFPHGQEQEAFSLTMIYCYMPQELQYLLVMSFKELRDGFLLQVLLIEYYFF
ncbi:hypothetical protein AVM71_17665 (plasmid) [Piscirickettsia salmonis]|nr:hypothetical protein AVM71_17665 [Piscirickettsia salmonis]